MSVFSDDDLKRLKEGHEKYLPEGKWLALLARLEAAEKYLRTCPEGDSLLYSFWKKTSGK